MQTQLQHANLNMPAVSPTIDPTVDPDIVYKSQTEAVLAPPDKQLSGSDLSSCSHYDGPPPPGPEVAEEYSGTRRPGVQQIPQSSDSKRNGYYKLMPLQNLGLSDNNRGADEGHLPELHKDRSYSSVYGAVNMTQELIQSTAYSDHDEALQRWKAAAISAGDSECYTGMHPLTNGWFDEGYAICTMLIIFGGVLVSPFMGLWLLWRAVCGSAVAATVIALWMGTALLPCRGYWKAASHAHIWCTWRRYFRLRWVTPKRPFLNRDQQYLYLHFPHAVFPIGSFLSISITANRALTGIGQEISGAVATVLVTAPLIKHLFRWMGAFPGDRSAINKRLATTSVGVLPEGIAGIFQGANMHHERIFFNKRKGIIAIAIRNGTDIVPCYFIGQSQIFSFWGSPTLSHKLRTSIGLFSGRWGLPLPHKCDIVAVIGHPIQVEKVDHPSHEQVDKVHAEVVAAVKQLYVQHRSLVPGFEHKDLDVV